MSVSDPLIKDIKALTLKIFNEFQTAGLITDSNQNVLQFCQTVEKIFQKGLILTMSTFSGIKNVDAYSWMIAMAAESNYSDCFSYSSSVREVQNCKNVNTTTGKFRLLIRYCLVKKCLHMPLEILNDSSKNKLFYKSNSIIGDEILSAILLSVLLQCSKITFRLELQNSYFLDNSWQLPEMMKLELVPCKSLGIGISFSANRAIIVQVTPNSVAAESGEISVGDVLANLNGVEINYSCKGRLNPILRCSKGQPVNLVIIKAFYTDSQDVFLPIKNILQNLQIDLRKTKNEESSDSSRSETLVKNNITSGYKARYLGSVSVGSKGSVKQIEEALKGYMITSNKKIEKLVNIEIGEINIKVFDLETNEIILKHSYMQISSCGSAPNLPHYIAYIAGEENCDTAPSFTCYIFYVDNTEDAATVLQSIGQGFYRTHFAV